MDLIEIAISVATGYVRAQRLPPPPPPYPLPPFSSSLISLVVSVDVKHHVYLLYGSTTVLENDEKGPSSVRPNTTGSNCFKHNAGETSERRAGAHMDFP